MKKKRFILLLVFLSAIIFIAEGVGFNVFTVWNWSPLIISFLIFNSAKKIESLPREWGAVGFLMGSMFLSLYIHAAWMFDIGGTKTSSSTSALIFIFIPVYALILGVVGYFLGSYLGNKKIKKV